MPLLAALPGARRRSRLRRWTEKHLHLWRWLPAAVREVRSRHEVPLPQQALAFAVTALPRGFSPEEFYQFGWWNAEGRRSRREFLSWRAFRRLDARENPRPFRILTLHKYVTHVMLSAAGVPLPAFHGLFHPDYGFDAQGAPLRAPADLRRVFAAPGRQPVVKLAVGLQGRGFLAFGPSGAEPWRTLDGRVFDASSLHAHLTSRPEVEWLVQERVRHHPFFARYGAGGGKLRLVTLNGTGGPVVASGMVGIAFGAELAVNGQQGSMHAGVDLRTGRLAAAHRRWVLGGTPEHPRSGDRIEGELLPRWDEAVELALRGARALPWLRLVAWDLGLDEERGWLVFEANVHFGTVSLQTSSGGFLGGPIGARVRSRGSEASPEARTPRVGGARRVLRDGRSISE